MTWEPKNKLDDDDVDVSDDDMDKDDYRSDKTGQLRVQLSLKFAPLNPKLHHALFQ